jgi:hypothetical protein
VDDLEEIVAHAEVILIGNQNQEFLPVLARLGRGKLVLDLTPAGLPPETGAVYERVSS